MKPTLNEEIGMSTKGIDYVNNLEVKNPELLNKEVWMEALKNDIPEYLCELEQKRIRRQSINGWICVVAIIALALLINTLNK